VLDNVAFPLELKGAGKPERHARAHDYLTLVGLADFAHAYPNELSGGMKQRAAIARGLVQDPQVLLMDEPFAALDEQTRMKMGAEVLRIWEQTRKTVIFVTHNLTEAVFLCDHVIVLGARPAVILDRVPIDLPRPRTYDVMATEKFGRLRDRIWRQIMDIGSDTNGQ
jgi:NitT/TauT family transport system ATP-binding protein